jgi:hypothetical protein
MSMLASQMLMLAPLLAKGNRRARPNLRDHHSNTPGGISSRPGRDLDFARGQLGFEPVARPRLAFVGCNVGNDVFGSLGAVV